VLLHHISVVKKELLEFIFSQALEFIWKYSHCAAIRIHLHHFKQEDGSLKADPDFKKVLKANKFRWKTVTNDMETGLRQEILEVQNSEFKDQMRQSKAIIFRKGVQKEDILKEPISIFFSSMAAFGRNKNPDKVAMLGA